MFSKNQMLNHSLRTAVYTKGVSYSPCMTPWTVSKSGWYDTRMFYQYTILLSCKLGKSWLLFFIKNKSSSIIYEKKPYDDIKNNIKMKFRSFNRENACRKVKHRDTITPFSPNVLTAIRQGMPISSMDANKDSNECVKGTAGKDIIQKIYMYNTYT